MSSLFVSTSHELRAEEMYTVRREKVIVQLDKELRQASSKGDREFSGAAVDLSLIVNR